jgi:hypothetical protein
MTTAELLDQLAVAAEAWIGTPIGGLLIEAHNHLSALDGAR